MSGGLRHLLLLAVLVPGTVLLAYRIGDYAAPLPPERGENSPAVADNAPATDISPPPAYSAPPFSSFSVILDRPLFVESRRKKEVAVAAPAPTVTRTLEATLRGILFSSTGKVALLSENGSGDVVRVAEQEMFQGWRLEHIAPDSATFTRGEETVTLRLTYKASE